MDDAARKGPHAVSSHLRIRLEEYDHRIRTFVPWYEAMLDEAERVVGLVAPERPTFLDLGTGTGALAERCLRARPGGRLVGLDTDPGMLAFAASRLAGHDGVEMREGSYLEVELPRCDLVVASISLHHVGDPGAKRDLYRRCREALRPGGAMVLADTYLPREPRLVEAGMAGWRRHLEATYPPDEAAGHLEAWADEDTYMPLADELAWLEEAGFRPEVTWRRELFAVLLAAVA